MKYFVYLLVAFSLGGCGSLLVAMNANEIKEDPTERTWGRRIEDESIETKAIVNLHNAHKAFDQAHVNVVSYNGYVLVVGQVPSTEIKQVATDVIRPLTGVRRIYNELSVAAPSSSMTRTSDTWITSKVKSALVARKDIHGNRIKVTTENGVVYLMGLANTAQSQLVTDAARDITGVQRVVSMLEIVDK